jgi:co-chaperonin GroES (HSP10)
LIQSASIFDILKPSRTWMLVREFERSSMMGTLHRPEKYEDSSRPRSGVVMSVGPAVMCLKPGNVAIWGFHSGQVNKMGNQAAVMLPEEEVMAYVESEDLLPSAHPDESWIEHLKPRTGQALVERLEQPIRRGRIHIPEGVSASTRSREAVVVAVADNVTSVEPGDGVLLGNSVGRILNLGHRTLHPCSPHIEVIAHVDIQENAPLHSSESPIAGAEQISPMDDVRWDEGDVTGPR